MNVPDTTPPAIKLTAPEDGATLSGTAGNVLDPAMSLRRSVALDAVKWAKATGGPLKGKVPAKVVEQRYGDQVRAEIAAQQATA